MKVTEQITAIIRVVLRLLEEQLPTGKSAYIIIKMKHSKSEVLFVEGDKMKKIEA